MYLLLFLLFLLFQDMFKTDQGISRMAIIHPTIHTTTTTTTTTTINYHSWLTLLTLLLYYFTLFLNNLPFSYDDPCMS